MPPSTNSRMPVWAVKLEGKVETLRNDIFNEFRVLNESLKFRDNQTAQMIEGAKSEATRANQRLDEHESFHEDAEKQDAGRRRDRLYNGLMPIFAAMSGAGIAVLVTHLLAGSH